MLEGCDPPPKLIITSETPEKVTDACEKRIENLNEKITAEYQVKIGSRVPEEYTSEYENAIKGCVSGTMVQKLGTEIKSEILSRSKRSSFTEKLFDGVIDRISKFVTWKPEKKDKAGEKLNSTGRGQNSSRSAGLHSVLSLIL